MYEAKTRLVGERVAVGPGGTAVPVKLTLCGLLFALSLMVSVAVRDPVAVALNVTSIAHAVCGSKAPEQLPPAWKSPGFVPPMVMLFMIREALPVFERYTTSP